MSEERLQKFLAGAGIASRRGAEALIRAGRVQLNERTVTELGTKVDPRTDFVKVDGRLVSRNDARAYYLLYKPSGCVTTASDPEGRPTAFDYLRGVRERVFPVGRLDWDAEGAVLFTDDGELANRLSHPRYGHRRVYLVKVKGDPERSQLDRLRTGLTLEDGVARAFVAEIHEKAEKNTWVRVEVGEGRYHLVKRMFEAVGLFVLRLFRPEFGGISVAGLRPGRFRTLSPDEQNVLKAAVGLLPAGETRTPGTIPRALPKAARRHGHGPPEPPAAEDRRLRGGEKQPPQGARSAQTRRAKPGPPGGRARRPRS